MLTLDEIAGVLEAQRLGGNTEFHAVSTDSRKITKGDLFVALKGKNFDAADFVSRAASDGAAAAMVERKVESVIPLLIVKDTRLALGKLASFWRSRFSIPVLAVTGSNGKTTVKEMLASILKERGEVLATKGNLNNDIGLPLTLLDLRENHDYAVVEMGMNHPGEIAYLCKIARPDIALVTNAASAHLEGLGGSVYNVAKAKGEIFEGLKETGIAIINADDVHAPLWRELAKGKQIVEFGLNAKADFTADHTLHEMESEILMHTPQGEIGLKINVPGLHNVRNVLAAAAAAMSAGVDRDAVRKGLEKFTGVPGRMQRKPGKQGAFLVDDTYNANPDSVLAAISWLAQRESTMLIMGDMGELGPDSMKLHAEMGKSAREAGIGMLLTLGKSSEESSKMFGNGAHHFEDIDALVAKAESLLCPGMTVLVKGSRFMKMERVVEKLQEKDKACS